MNVYTAIIKSHFNTFDLQPQDRRSGQQMVKGSGHSVHKKTMGLAKGANSNSSTSSGVVRPTRQMIHDLHVLQLNKDRDARAALDRGGSRNGMGSADSIAANRVEICEQKLVRAVEAFDCVQKDLVQARLERDASRNALTELVRLTDKHKEDLTAQVNEARHNKNVHRTQQLEAEDDLETSQYKLAQVYKQHMASAVQIDRLRQENQAHVLQRQANAAEFEKLRLQNIELRKSLTKAKKMAVSEKPILPKQHQTIAGAQQHTIKKNLRPLELPKSSFSTLMSPQPSVLSIEASPFVFGEAPASVLAEKAALSESFVPREHRSRVRFANKYAWQQGKKRLQRHVHDSQCQDAMSYTSVALGMFDGESCHVCTCTVLPCLHMHCLAMFAHVLSCHVCTCTVLPCLHLEPALNYCA